VLVLQKTGDKTADVFVVHVAAEARRQGVATALYDAAEKSGLTIRSGQSGFTAEGKAFVEARTGQPAPVSALQLHADELLNPVYETQAAAEGVAASINNAVRNAEQPVGALTAEQTKNISNFKSETGELGQTVLLNPDFDIHYGATAEETKPVFQQIADALPVREKTNLSVVQTHDETVELAHALGIEPDQVLPNIRNLYNATTAAPEQVVATKMGLNKLADQVARLSRAAGQLGDKGAVAYTELKAAVENLWEMQGLLSGTSRNIGRTLDAHKIAVGMDVETTAAARTAQKAGAAANDISKLSRQELIDLGRLIEMSDGRAEEVLGLMRGKVLENKLGKEPTTALGKANQVWKKTRDFLLAFRMEMMLSGPKTPAGNILSNMVAAVVRPIEYMITGVPGKFLGNPELFNEGADMLLGLVGEHAEAWKGMARAFRAGKNIMDEAPSVLQDSGAFDVDSSQPVHRATRSMAEAKHVPDGSRRVFQSTRGESVSASAGAPRHPQRRNHRRGTSGSAYHGRYARLLHT
jgi:hypothetical protein